MKHRQLPSLKVLTDMLNDWEHETQKDVATLNNPASISQPETKKETNFKLIQSSSENTSSNYFPLNLGSENKILVDAYWKALQDYYKTL